jgi:hypothetical protein
VALARERGARESGHEGNVKPHRDIFLANPTCPAARLAFRFKETRMEPLRLLETATALFVISALGGVVMAGIRLSGKHNPPIGLAMLHGFLAAAGLTLLIYGAVFVGLPSLANYAAVLFVIAAAGGIALNLGYHWKDLPLPKGLMVGHAILAVLAFLLVALATWNAARG